MNFRCLTDEDTEINSYVSSRKTFSYICTKSNFKYMFGIGTDFNNYPYIQNTIMKLHKKIKPKTTIYYICKQIESSFTYVPGYGRIYRYIYKPIIEITRSKHEIIDVSNIDQKQEETPIEIPISTGCNTYSSTSGTTSSYWGDYITAGNTTSFQ